MITRIIVGIAIVSALALAAGLVARMVWIKTRIVALTAQSADFTEANLSLPPKGPRPRVVLIGDSRISRWPTVPMSDRIEIINRGVGGETSAQMAHRFQRDAIALKPDVIVIQSGGNDLIAATFLDDRQGRAVVRQTARNLLELTAAGAASGAEVLLTTIVPPARPEWLRLPVWKESLRGAVAEVNDELRRSAPPDHAKLIDLSAALSSGDDRTLPDRFRSDALHLNRAGYDRLTQLVLEPLSSLPVEGRPLR